MKNKIEIDPGSFRDWSGFVFYTGGEPYRQVNLSYKSDYDLFMSSGLYDKLVEEKLLIPHQETDVPSPDPSCSYKLIRPLKIPYISYPFEWCFSQLKYAALTTLKVQQTALHYGMILKDGSAYNIQFYQSKPIFIDTLSFGIYQEGQPWNGYRQFCQHFLAPLLLMAYVDMRLNTLLKNFIDGIPLDLASRLLPKNTYFRFSALMHIHLHARSQKIFALNKNVPRRNPNISKKVLLGMAENMYSVIDNMHCRREKLSWENYFRENNYTPNAREKKRTIFSNYLDRIAPKSLFDLGSNTGEYSRIASRRGILTYSFDMDPISVEKNYLSQRSENDNALLPLVMDLTNPSPAIGWANEERDSFLKRGKADAIAALALVHHLVITYHIPLDRISRIFSELASWLIIEYISVKDSQVQEMIAFKTIGFHFVAQENFEEIFRGHYTIVQKDEIPESERTMYLMKRKN
jgi:hypothetical protein